MTWGQRSIVLGYHSVSETWDNSVAVRPEGLRAQLALLLDRGYRPVTFSDAVTAPEQRTVAITFDDAFLAVYELALPVLQEVGAVATVFAPTSFLDVPRALAWDGYGGTDRGAEAEMRPMGWQHLRDLARRGWEVGSHTVHHPHLPRLSDDELAAELRHSRKRLSEGLGGPCTTLAYPYGDVDARVRAATAAAGYQAACALGPQWRRGDRLWWPRTGVYRCDDLPRFRLKLQAVIRSRAFAAGVTSARRLSATHA